MCRRKEEALITRVGMAPRRPGLTTAAFLQHWRTSHADAAGNIPGLERYVQLHPVFGTGGPLLPHPGFDACSMLDFPDLETLDAAFASSNYQSRVVEDEEQFIDRSRHSLILTERSVVATIPEGHVALLTIVRRHPAVAPPELRSAMDEWATSEGGEGVEILSAVPTDRRGRQGNAADGVLLRGFVDEAAALQWLTDDTGGVAADLTLAGTVFGTSRAIVRPFRVC